MERGTVSTVTVAESVEAAPEPEPGRRRNRRADLLMLGACLAGALYLTAGLWRDPYHVVVFHNQGDQALFEWLLAYNAHWVTHGTNPWWTTLLNAPMGVNLAVNTSMVLVGALLTPVTLTLGAPVSFLVVLTANLALSPYAWYHVLSRHVTRTRAAAVLGGLFCGFAPGIVSHANAHLNFTGQFLVPFIVWRVLRLAREPGPGWQTLTGRRSDKLRGWRTLTGRRSDKLRGWRTLTGRRSDKLRGWRDGAVLALLVVLQFSIAAEMLFFVALACAIFLAAWAVLRRRETGTWQETRTAVPPLLRGLGVTAGLSGVLLAYPLWMQFAGPQGYHGIGFDQHIHSEDLAAFPAIPFLSPARWLGTYVKLAPNWTEETTFYGPLLLILVTVCLVVLWRRTEVRALALTGLAFALLALGPKPMVAQHTLPIPLPYRVLKYLPLFDSALPARFALMLIPIIGLLLAYALDRALELPARPRGRWVVGFAAALLPIVPLPIPPAPRDPVPHFFSAGTWRQYVHSGQTLVPIPPPSDLLPDGQRWQTATNFGFAIPAGFFLGPGGPHGQSKIGPVPRPTDALLTDVALHGTEPTIHDYDRRLAREDLAYWHGSVIVLSDGGQGSRWTGNRDKLLRVATELFGPPQRVEDVWVWTLPTPTGDSRGG